MKNSTKDKGDTGVIQIIADLDKYGIKSALPMSEHLPFDLIAISDDGNKLSRVSVKYKSSTNGIIAVPLRSISTNMKGWKAKTINYENIDCVAIYCPDIQECFYINILLLKHIKSTFYIRIKDSLRINSYINWAKDFKNPLVIFDK